MENIARAFDELYRSYYVGQGGNRDDMQGYKRWLAFLTRVFAALNPKLAFSDGAFAIFMHETFEGQLPCA